MSTLSVLIELHFYFSSCSFLCSIPPNLRSVVYLAAIKYGESEDWDYLFEIYKSTQFPSEQRKIMFALTDTRNKTILKKYVILQSHGAAYHYKFLLSTQLM